jgi:chromosome partitioning protein
MKILALCNQKGGIGKTTLTLNLGEALARMNNRVLLIDLDQQGHLTEAAGLRELYDDEENPSLYQRLTQEETVPAESLIRTTYEGYSLIPSTYKMALVEGELFMARNREHKLKDLLKELDNKFDWVLMDCPPSLGNMTDNALNAAKHVIIPIQAEPSSLRAINLLLDQIQSVEQGLKIQIDITAIVPNLIEDTAQSNRIVTQLRESFGDAVIPFDFKKRVVLREAWEAGRSVFNYKPSIPAKTESIEELKRLYLRLAEFISQKMEG